jgi:hypothetical protein
VTGPGQRGGWRAFTRDHAGSTARPWSPERTQAAPAECATAGPDQRRPGRMLMVDRVRRHVRWLTSCEPFASSRPSSRIFPSSSSHPSSRVVTPLLSLNGVASNAAELRHFFASSHPSSRVVTMTIGHDRHDRHVTPPLRGDGDDDDGAKNTCWPHSASSSGRNHRFIKLASGSPCGHATLANNPAYLAGLPARLGRLPLSSLVRASASAS